MEKRRINILPSVLIILACGVIGFAIGYFVFPLFGSGRVKDGLHQITVCETTDIHGAYFSKSYDSREVRTSMSNVSSYVKSLREEGSDPVLVDNGDNLQGDNAAYYYNYVATDESHIFTMAAEYIGYDALVVGNHDIETGHEVYDKLTAHTKIPYLAANAVRDGGEDSGKPYFKPYVIIRRDGVKIALIGMTNANIKSWLSENKWEGMDFVRISDIAQSWVDEVISKEKPHLVLLSIHSGTGSDEGGLENEALFLAKTLKGIDAVLCGHDHSAKAMEVENPDGKVLLVNGGTKAAYVAQCDFELSFKRGRVVEKKASCKLVDMTEYKPDSQYDDKFFDCYSTVNEFANRQIGYISSDMYFADALKGASPYLNLVHAVQLDAMDADVSFSAPLSTYGKVSAGPVTFQNLVDIYRFENQLFSVEMTGRQIKDYLEFSYDLWVRNDGPSYNFDSAAGIIYTVSRSAGKGERVDIRSMADGTPFNMDKTYTVAINSYRASGGGGHVTEGLGMDADSLVVIDREVDIRTLIGEYIKSKGNIKPDESENWKFVK